MGTLLFQDYEFREVAEDRLGTMKRAAAAMVEADLEDVNEAVERLKRIGEFEVPTLDRLTAKLQVNESNLIIRADLRVPLAGEVQLMHTRASQFTLSPPHGRVDSRKGGALLMTDDFPRSATREQIKQRFAQRVDHVERYLAFLRTDADSHYSQVSNLAQNLVRQRRTQLAQFRELQAGLTDGV